MPPFAVATTTGKAIRKLDPDGRQMRRMERDFEAAMSAALNRLRLDTVRDIGDDPQVMLIRLNDEAFTRPFQDAITQQLERVALAGADFGRQQVERDVFGVKAIEVGMWDLANNAATQWALGYGYELVRGLLQTTRDWISAQIAEYVQNSMTIGQLVQKIKDGTGFSDERAIRVAVTEVTRAFAEGNMASWRASGVIQRRRWNTNNDELVCPVCGPLAGTVVGLDEAFAGGVAAPPAHPRCRCWITPVVE